MPRIVFEPDPIETFLQATAGAAAGLRDTRMMQGQADYQQAEQDARFRRDDRQFQSQLAAREGFAIRQGQRAAEAKALADHLRRQGWLRQGQALREHLSMQGKITPDHEAAIQLGEQTGDWMGLRTILDPRERERQRLAEDQRRADEEAALMTLEVDGLLTPEQRQAISRSPKARAEWIDRGERQRQERAKLQATEAAAKAEAEAAKNLEYRRRSALIEAGGDFARADTIARLGDSTLVRSEADRLLNPEAPRQLDPRFQQNADRLLLDSLLQRYDNELAREAMASGIDLKSAVLPEDTAKVQAIRGRLDAKYGQAIAAVEQRLNRSLGVSAPQPWSIANPTDPDLRGMATSGLWVRDGSGRPMQVPRDLIRQALAVMPGDAPGMSDRRTQWIIEQLKRGGSPTTSSPMQPTARP